MSMSTVTVFSFSHPLSKFASEEIMSAVDLHSLAAVVDSRRRSSHLLGTFDATVGCGAEEEEWSNKGRRGESLLRHDYCPLLSQEWTVIMEWNGMEEASLCHPVALHTLTCGGGGPGGPPLDLYSHFFLETCLILSLNIFNAVQSILILSRYVL